MRVRLCGRAGGQDVVSVPILHLELLRFVLLLNHTVSSLEVDIHVRLNSVPPSHDERRHFSLPVEGEGGGRGGEDTGGKEKTRQKEKK